MNHRRLQRRGGSRRLYSTGQRAALFGTTTAGGAQPHGERREHARRHTTGGRDELIADLRRRGTVALKSGAGAFSSSNPPLAGPSPTAKAWSRSPAKIPSLGVLQVEIGDRRDADDGDPGGGLGAADTTATALETVADFGAIGYALVNLPRRGRV